MVVSDTRCGLYNLRSGVLFSEERGRKARDSAVSQALVKREKTILSRSSEKITPDRRLRFIGLRAGISIELERHLNIAVRILNYFLYPMHDIFLFKMLKPTRT